MLGTLKDAIYSILFQQWRNEKGLVVMSVNYLDTENYNQIVKYKIYVSFIGFMLQYVISGNDSC